MTNKDMDLNSQLKSHIPQVISGAAFALEKMAGTTQSALQGLNLFSNTVLICQSYYIDKNDIKWCGKPNPITDIFLIVTVR